MPRPRRFAMVFCLLAVSLSAGAADAQKGGKGAGEARVDTGTPVVGGVLGGVGSSTLAPRDIRDCERGRAQSCMRVGDWLVTAGRDGATYHERACMKGAFEGCYKAGDAYRRSRKADRVRSRRLLVRGCDGGDDLSCFGLANWLFDEGTPAARRQAKAMMTRACRMSYTPGCEKYGVPRPDDWHALPPDAARRLRR